MVAAVYVHDMFTSAAIARILIPVAQGSLALPVFSSRIPAGFPSPADDFADGVLDLNDLIEHPAATFVVRVSGDSMTGAGIFDGDLLIVDRSLTAKSGHIVVASSNEGMVVKRLEKRADLWWLVPANPAFEPTPLAEGAEVWGVVKNAIRNLT